MSEDNSTKEQCGNCKFFLCHNDDNDDKDNSSGLGDCRRFPPAIPISEKMQENVVFPVVRDYFWCGEWRAAKVPTSFQDGESINNLNLSTRARVALRSNWCGSPILSISALISCTAEELLEIRNFGKTYLREVRVELAARGLKLKGD